jgi:small subunit ribosomal protein S21
MEINVKRVGSVEKALRILKRRLDKEGVIKDVRRRRCYEKPSVEKYRKKKRAKYIARLKSLEDRIWR